MKVTSPVEMLAIVLEDLKSQRLTQHDIAEKTGYKTRQAISTLLSSGKYMTQQQAERFAKAFGYYEGFLTTGTGSLRSPDEQEDEGASIVFPKLVLALKPYETEEEFKKAFNRLAESAFSVYGEDAVIRFLSTCIRYLSFFNELDNDTIHYLQSINIVPSDHRPSGYERIKTGHTYSSEEYKYKAKEVRDKLMTKLFNQYMELTRK